jgi:hypothetical protein
MYWLVSREQAVVEKLVSPSLLNWGLFFREKIGWSKARISILGTGWGAKLNWLCPSICSKWFWFPQMQAKRDNKQPCFPCSGTGARTWSCPLIDEFPAFIQIYFYKPFSMYMLEQNVMLVTMCMTRILLSFFFFEHSILLSECTNVAIYNRMNCWSFFI